MQAHPPRRLPAVLDRRPAPLPREPSIPPRWGDGCIDAGLLRPPLKEVAEWTDRYRRFWDERYDRLDEYLDELQGRGRGQGARKEKDDGGEW